MTTSHLHARLRLRDTLVDLAALLLLAAIAISLGGCEPIADLADDAFNTTGSASSATATPRRAMAPAALVINSARWDGRDLVVDGSARNPGVIEVFDADTGEQLAVTRSRMSRIHGNYWSAVIRDPDTTPRRISAVAESVRGRAVVADIAGDDTLRNPRDAAAPAS